MNIAGLKSTVFLHLIDPTLPTRQIIVRGHLVNETTVLPANISKSTQYKSDELAKNTATFTFQEGSHISLPSVTQWATDNNYILFQEGEIVYWPLAYYGAGIGVEFI